MAESVEVFMIIAGVALLCLTLGAAAFAACDIFRLLAAFTRVRVHMNPPLCDACRENEAEWMWHDAGPGGLCDACCDELEEM